MRKLKLLLPISVFNDDVFIIVKLGKVPGDFIGQFKCTFFSGEAGWRWSQGNVKGLQ